MRVVFVPGLGLDFREWDGVRDRVHADHSVIHLPSLGRRARRRTDFSVEAAADRLVAAIDACGPDVVLVGHSASCAVVVETAVRRTVAGLVLAGPATDPRAATWPRMIAQWLRTAVHEQVGEVPVLAPQYAHNGLVTMARGMNVMRRFRVDQALTRTGVPVTILRGVHDRLASDDWCRHLAGSAGGPATVVTIPAAAHMLPITHPAAVAWAVNEVALSN